jgi:citrate synthase
LKTEAELRQAGYLPAAETAQRLGIKLPTLYAYVSRGLITARRPADSRASFFAPGEVERLRSRPARAAQPELEIASAVTLLRPDGLFYRGHGAVALSRERSYEEVAELLWHASLNAQTPWPVEDAAAAAAKQAQAGLPPDVLPLERLAVAVAAIAPLDPLRFDLTPTAVERAARRLIATMVAALPGAARPPARGDVRGVPLASSIAGILAAALSRRRATRAFVNVVNAALILIADHELAASTLAARVAAAARAPVYASVLAGLAVMQGPRHGATSLWAEDLLAEIAAGATPERTVAEHFRRGEYLFGFGHLLYESGDPRAGELLDLVFEHAPARHALPARALLDFAQSQELPPPSIDFALAALAHSFQLLRGSGQAIFAVGRSAGWIAHALEEHARRSQYRIRASYTGPPPQAAEPAD